MSNSSQEEAARHKAKMAKRKAAQDAEVASKTAGGGLLIVHTGPGKGKSTAAWGLALRALGHGWRKAQDCAEQHPRERSSHEQHLRFPW